jgi:hypothetical protein
LIAQQRHASKEVANGSTVGNTAADDTAAGSTTEPSGGLLFNNDGNMDEKDPIPIKKLRKVVISDPVTPVAAQV